MSEPPTGAPYDDAPPPAAPPPAAPPPAPELADLETPWRRLDPRMLMIHPVQEIVRFLPALIGAVVVGQSSDTGGRFIELAVLVLAVGVGLLRWATTRFRIEHGQIELRKGLLNRQVIATPADRVRTVDVTAPPFHRVLGLAKVEIGTAGHTKERLVLDSLPTAEARHLREELIHRRRVAADPASPAPYGEPVPGLAPPPAGPADERGFAPVWSGDDVPGTETELLRLDPRWVGFAPLTLTGVFSALAILGFGNQFLQRYLQRTDLGGAVSGLGEHPLWVDVVVVLVGLVVLVSLLAVVGYALQFWGFRLTRHRGGTLHVTRGLLTTRETSIEEKRLRGVELGRPLGLRLAKGARLQAITTGLSRKERDRGSAWLSPPAPYDVVARVGRDVLEDDEALAGPLHEHGPAARRRRYTRAAVPALVLAVAGWLLVGLAQWWVGVGVLATLPLLLSPVVAGDRYAGLGHRLLPAHLVVQHGSFVRRRDVLERDGVIGWVVQQSFFQRRVGVAHVLATTAAGKQSYVVRDVPLDTGVAVALAVDPDLLTPFLEER
ncbi:PH domain-containing protein [Lapillicoccus jejuensis]|uniref:Putative membrane protein n=1 Tax=Lapillicoccus jejuensis TaxID=402171 RepID=A0A542E1E8_9MICO|nr:PH domain-containing protein [Lapillicoccus jejuensis]TQJ09135.1 putative membrane protein [Lapillicoccus jejuensis]